MTPSDTELVRALPGALRVRRRPYAYATSCPLTELQVDYPGRQARLLLKEYPARATRPTGDHDDAREIEAYRRLLGPAGIGPALHASGPDWLVLDLIEGVELWQVGELPRWEGVATWLGALHRRFTGHEIELRAAVPRLLDERAYARWLERAASRLDGVLDLAVCRAALTELAALPRTLVHGEFYPSNVLVAGDRVVPIDWETAGVGPGVLDLAALLTGWDEDAAQRLVRAYGGADERALDCARLALALRWLGSAPEWTPPAEHRYDWLGEARAAAGRLAP